MNSTVTFIFELLVNLFQGVAFTMFCNTFFERRFRRALNNIFCIITVSALFVTVTALNMWGSLQTPLEIMLYFVIMIPFSVFCHRGKLALRIIMPILIFALLMGIGAGYTAFMSLISDREVLELLKFNSVYHVNYIILTNTTYGFILYLLCKLFREKIDLKKPADIISFIVIPLLTLAIIAIITIVITDKNINETNRFLLGIIALITFVIATTTFRLMTEISKAAQVKSLNLVMAREQNMYKTELQRKNNYIDEVSKIRHEMKRKLYIIGSLIEEGKCEEALDICQKGSSELKDMSPVYKTENIYLNSILNLTHKRAKDSGASFEADIKSDLSLVEGVDLLSVCGNLIDNAFEAMAESQKENCLIIKTREKIGYYVISIKNTIKSSVLEVNPSLKTTKNNREAHGHGLKIVKNLTENYQGSLQLTEENGFFIATVILKIPSR